MKRLVLTAVALTLSFATSALADQWTKADELFAKREGDRTAIAEARAEYKAILANASTKADKLRAVSQLDVLRFMKAKWFLLKTMPAAVLPFSRTAGVQIPA